jgi:four helix bundle protein
MEANQKPPNERPYDLEGRTFLFAKETRSFVKRLSRTVENLEDIRQLVRSSGSVGANYIKANESVSKKDFLLRIKTCRKESKDSAIFAAILRKSE